MAAMARFVNSSVQDNTIARDFGLGERNRQTVRQGPDRFTMVAGWLEIADLVRARSARTGSRTTSRLGMTIGSQFHVGEKQQDWNLLVPILLFG
jgi:hypothetical protein